MRKYWVILVVCLGCLGSAYGQSNTINLTVTSTPTRIIVNQNCNYVVIQENSASPTNNYTITLPGASQGINYPAGAKFIFTASGNGFVSGQTIGTINIATGSASFVGIESIAAPVIPANVSSGGGGGGGGPAPAIVKSFPGTNPCSVVSGQDTVQVGFPSNIGPEYSVNGQAGCVPLNATDQFDVLGYGAKGDGTTSDTTAVATAYAAACAAGGTVYFPASRTYKFAWPTLTSCAGWVIFKYDGVLSPTNTFVINQAQVAVIGGAQSTENGFFNQWPNGFITPGTNSPVISITTAVANPVAISGVGMDGCVGDCIQVTNGSNNVTIERSILRTSVSSTGSPVNIDMTASGGGFNFWLAHDSLVQESTGPVFNTVATGLVYLTDSLVSGRTISASNVGAGSGVGQIVIQRVLSENLADSAFITFNTTAGQYSETVLDNIEIADRSGGGGAYLASNAGGTLKISVKSSRGFATGFFNEISGAIVASVDDGEGNGLGTYSANNDAITEIAKGSLLSPTEGHVLGAPSGVTNSTLTVQPVAAAKVAQAIKGVSGQTGDLLDFYSSTPTLLAHFDSAGNLTVPSCTGCGTSTNVSPSQATVYVATNCTGLGTNCVAAVADDSTDNATAFASVASKANAYVPKDIADLPTVLFAAGTFKYSSGLNFTKPVIIQCENGGVLDYSGSAHAMDWGPTSLTGSTYQTTYYLQNCGFSGGASMTEGIYVNDGVLYPRIQGNRFVNFGNSTATVWQVFFNAPSIGIDDPEVVGNFFFNNDNTARNGVKVASGNGLTTNQLRFHDNIMLCAQVPGTTNMNGTHSCSSAATGVFSDGLGSLIEHNNIAWYQPDVQLGSNSGGTTIHSNIMETNTSSSSVTASAINFGDSTGGNCVACAVDSVLVDDLSINVHNGDDSTTSSVIGPSTTSSLMTNWEISRFRITQLSASVPVVFLNNTAAQNGNIFVDIKGSTSGPPLSATTFINSTGSNLGSPFIGLGTAGAATGVPAFGAVCSNSTISAQGCYYRYFNKASTGAVFSRITMDTAGDSQVYPNSGGFIQHSATQGTKLGDWEGLPVQILTSPTAGNLGLNTVFLPQGGEADEGTTFSASGCSISAHKGGAAIGQYTSGTSGTCTVTITPGATAPNGWACWENDLTTPADGQHQTSASSATVAVISGTTVSGDVVNFGCHAY